MGRDLSCCFEGGVVSLGADRGIVYVDQSGQTPAPKFGSFDRSSLIMRLLTDVLLSCVHIPKIRRGRRELRMGRDGRPGKDMKDTIRIGRRSTLRASTGVIRWGHVERSLVVIGSTTEVSSRQDIFGGDVSVMCPSAAISSDSAVQYEGLVSLSPCCRAGDGLPTFYKQCRFDESSIV